jgi:glycosyltransferase involved in cell wall biosynthesis
MSPHSSNQRERSPALDRGDRPDVTVITPTFRRERKLVEAIESVRAQRGVTIEMLVLDDSPEGSARTAVEELGDPRIVYRKQAVPSKGRPALVRNDGAQLARGRYCYFLDDDDRVAEGALAAMVDALDARPDAGVAFGWVVPFGDDPAHREEKRVYFEEAAVRARMLPWSAWYVANILFVGTLMVNSACMIRRELIDALGGYDPSIPVYEDVDFYMRGIRAFGGVFVDRPILHYRTGASSLMFDLTSVKPIGDSYEIIHRKYRERYGAVEYSALMLLARLHPSQWKKTLHTLREKLT